MNAQWNTWLALSLIFLPLVSTAQDAASTEAQSALPQSSETPYEIVVSGEVSRARLRELIVEVEEDFFARFNEINADDDYDIICYEYVPTMSHIKKRVCEPAFMLRARGLNASETTFLLGQGGVDTNNAAQQAAFAHSPRSLRTHMASDYETLQEKLEAHNRSDAEFRQIGQALADLKNRLANYGEEDD